jgi:hypothetical protein
MGMPEAQTGWTVAMLDALPEGIERHEIIDGERFVTRAPGEAHQLVIGRQRQSTRISVPHSRSAPGHRGRSPGNPLLDYQVKRDRYLREGLAEYWVVNVEARNVSRWRDRDDPGEVLSRRVEWSPPGAESPFVVDLPDFFDQALR